MSDSQDVNIFSIVPIEAAADPSLSKNELRVLITLLSFRGKNTNTVWPKRDRIRERLNNTLSLSRISETTTSLVNKGWLKKVGNGGRSAPSKYLITVPDREEKTDTENVTVTESGTVTGSVSKTVTETVSKTVTEPVTGKELTNEHTNELTKEGDKALSPYPPSPKKTARGKTDPPEDFQITPALIAWAAENKINVDLNSATHQWLDAMRAKGERKKDWVAAWRNAMRFAQKWKNEKLAEQASQVPQVRPVSTRQTTVAQELNDTSWAAGMGQSAPPAGDGVVIEQHSN